MKRSNKFAAVLLASLGSLAVAGALAHGGMGQMHAPMHGPGSGMPGMMFQGDPAAGADMGLVHQMLANHEQIVRSRGFEIDEP
ncbi:MAG: hypothetical protein WEC33_01165, partial [Dehalococcoidia bacterium]